MTRRAALSPRRGRSLTPAQRLTKPTLASTGPRGSLATDSSTTIVNGFNTQNNAVISGKAFTNAAGLTVSGGGTNSLQTLTITDCSFVGGLILSASIDTVYLTRCSMPFLGIACRAGTCDSVQVVSTSGDPFDYNRTNSDGSAPTTPFSTPWTFTDSIFQFSGTPGAGQHLDGAQIRGARDMVFRRCVFDVGAPWQNERSSALYFELANQGHIDNLVENCWLHGGGYVVYAEGTNIVFRDNWITGTQAVNDIGFNINYPHPSGNLATFIRTRWEGDNTPVVGYY